MTPQEVYDETVKLFENYFASGLHKLVLIRDLLPDDGDEAPKPVQSLQEALKSSGEKGLCETLDDVLGEIEKFCIFMDLLQVKIKREASETQPDSDTPEA